MDNKEVCGTCKYFKELQLNNDDMSYCCIACPDRIYETTEKDRCELWEGVDKNREDKNTLV